MNRVRADLLLFLAALIWGSAFVAQKTGADQMGPILFVSCRFIVSALVVAPLAWLEARSTLADAPALTAREWRVLTVIGISLFITAIAQQAGIGYTSASNASFLTAIYVVMAPFAAWRLMGEKPKLVGLFACLASLMGAGLLTGYRPGQPLSAGDMWVILSDVPCAIQLVLVGQFLTARNRPFLLCLTQDAVTGLGSLVLALLLEPVTAVSIRQALPAILYTGILSGGVALTAQIVAQRHTPPTEAALIMSLESVIGAVTGAAILGDRLTPSGMVGCGLILFSAILSQIAPWLMGVTARRPMEEEPQDTTS